jgi:hypothetical protein
MGDIRSLKGDHIYNMGTSIRNRSRRLFSDDDQIAYERHGQYMIHDHRMHDGVYVCSECTRAFMLTSSVSPNYREHLILTISLKINK